MGGKYWRARACDRVFLSDSKSQGVDNGSKKKNDSAKRNESAVARLFQGHNSYLLNGYFWKTSFATIPNSLILPYR